MAGSKRRYIILVIVLVTIVAVALTLGLGFGLRKKKSEGNGAVTPTTELPKPTTKYEPPPTAPTNADGPYMRGAVATDAGKCSEIGRDILKKNGTAVDATIASLFCVGVVNMHSTGIGGGGFMLVYKKKDNSATVINFRETAPAKANSTMYVNNSLASTLGPLSAGVPGEVKGMYIAHQRFGRLPWEQLVQPTIDLCKNGFPIGKPLHKAMMGTGKEKIKNDPGLRELLMDGNNFKQLGETITNFKLAKTLEIIRDDPMSFYNGSLAQTIAEDMKKAGGIITLDDLKNYTVEVSEPIENHMGSMRWFTVPSPASGPVITLILNIMKGYNLTKEARANTANSSLTYHRIVESFKLAYARRAELGDPNFVNNTDLLSNLTDPAYADALRQLIWDNQTHANASYYGNTAFEEDGGTAHVSVLSPEGDAVSVTSTINYWFGGKFSSNTSGIIYNNEMDDFSTPGLVNLYGIEPSPSNFIKPGKRPVSSICPLIFVNATGHVVWVAGASGGTRITTATALVTMSKLWFGRNVSEAVTEPRLHHQLLPPNVTVENNYPYIFPQGIQAGLRSRGQFITKLSRSIGVVQAISKEKDGKIFAKSDPRKHGWAAGF